MSAVYNFQTNSISNKALNIMNTKGAECVSSSETKLKIQSSFHRSNPEAFIL